MSAFAQLRRQGQRVYDGSLAEALEAEWKQADTHGGRCRAWWVYEGPDCAPFIIYTRIDLAMGGWMQLADITGEGQQTGRMNVLRERLEQFGQRRKLAVVFENVVHEGVAKHLIRHGYEQMNRSYIKHF